VRFRNLLSILFLLASSAFVTMAAAARFPDTIRDTLTVEGQPSRELAAFFGVSGEVETTQDLPVLDIASESTETNYGGVSKNRIRFARKGGELRVTVGDRWYDNETGTGTPVPRYSFTSPFIDPRLTVHNGWTTLLRHLGVKVPETKTHATVAAHVHTDEDRIPFLDVLVYMVYDHVENRWAYRVELGIDHRDRDARERALAEYRTRMRRIERRMLE
jgi:hypothetical protein